MSYVSAIAFLFFRARLEREIRKDQASLAAKCPNENALRAGMPDCESMISDCETGVPLSRKLYHFFYLVIMSDVYSSLDLSQPQANAHLIVALF